MGNNPSSKAPKSTKIQSATSESTAIPTVSALDPLSTNTRVLALKPIGISYIESLSQSQDLSTISLQRLGLPQIEQVGIFATPLKLEGVRSLLLDYNQLKTIPDYLALQPFITELSISHNDLTTVPSIGSTLLRLNLSWNKLIRIDENVSQLPLLQHLDLRHNMLDSRSIPDLTDLTNLTYFDISENRLTHWPRIDAPKLNYLYVDYNVNLGDCPPSFGPFPLLKEFSCSYSKVTIFPKFLMESYELEKLNIRHTLITRLPQSLALPNLKFLESSATKLLPPKEDSREVHDLNWRPPPEASAEVAASLLGLQRWNSLKDISMNGVGLYNLPPSLFYVSISEPDVDPQQIAIRNLNRLCLRWNNIYEIPAELLQLVSLNVLDLTGNHISSISSGITVLTNLHHLAIAHNRLMDLPVQITEMTSLKSLVLEHNTWEDPLLEKVYWESDGVSQIFDRIRDWHSENDIQMEASHIRFSAPNVLQKMPPINKPTEREILKDRFYGTIFGQALGDAYGLCSEFLMHTQATYSCDTDKVDIKMTHKDKHRIRWIAGDWTDDTDQAIFLLESMIQSYLEDHKYQSRTQATSQDERDVNMDGEKINRTKQSYPSLNVGYFATNLKQWMECGYPELGDDGGMGLGATVREVLTRRTFLGDPAGTAKTVWVNSGCRLAANGALMRCSPIALFGFDDPGSTVESDSITKMLGENQSPLGICAESVRKNTMESCFVTHADPRCLASCLALNMALVCMLRGQTDMDAILQTAFLEGKRAFCIYKDEDGIKGKEDYAAQIEELEKLIKSKNLFELELSDGSSIGYTYKCLGAAFAAFRSSNNFEQSIIKIIQCAGDADTNGAVVGALLGCKVGYSALPQTWLDSMPHRQWLKEKVDEAWQLVTAKMDAGSEK